MGRVAPYRNSNNDNDDKERAPSLGSLVLSSLPFPVFRKERDQKHPSSINNSTFTQQYHTAIPRPQSHDCTDRIAAEESLVQICCHESSRVELS